MRTRSETDDLSRAWPDPQEGDFGDPWLLDRHRIVHSAAFRRLQYKTQVFLPFEADHVRTRLTHTLEVAQVGMELAVRLSGRRELVELIALAHDLGHTPFGHAGERALDRVLAGSGGFEHNQQSLRIVTELEHPYPQFRGLNLTAAVRAGLAGHTGRYDREWSGWAGGLESQLASWADRLAYDAGDLEDALGAELLRPDDLADLALWRRVAEGLDERFRDRSIHAVRRVLVEGLQRDLVWALRVESGPAGPVVTLPAENEAELAAVEDVLFHQVYRHPRVAAADEAGGRIIERLFEVYAAEPSRMPPRFSRRVGDEPGPRVAADYLAGMTDRYCVKVYRQTFGEDDMLLRLRSPAGSDLFGA